MRYCGVIQALAPSILAHREELCRLVQVELECERVRLEIAQLELQAELKRQRRESRRDQ
jgi:hypothetical protein